MEYSVRVWSAVQGDVVPLRYVAEAMARCAATGYGTLPLHGPTLKNLRPERALLLLDAVKNGHLKVCDSQGRIANASELVDTAKELAGELFGTVPAEAMNAEAIVPFLYARRQQLVEWGKACGDVFLFVETPGTLVASDLRDFLSYANGPGYGRVIEPGYHRGAVGGGESEPWHDNLHGTALAPETAKPAPVETVAQRRDRFLTWFAEEQRINRRGALQRVFEREVKQNPKADRANIGKDIKKAQTEKKQPGGWASQLVQDGKRKG